jgi:transcription elongation factor Elf1
MTEPYFRCPRCGCTEYDEHDCGPDGYDDDITYQSESCKDCGLWHSGWTDKWLIDVDCWSDEEDAEEFSPELPNPS